MHTQCSPIPLLSQHLTAFIECSGMSDRALYSLSKWWPPRSLVRIWRIALSTVRIGYLFPSLPPSLSFIFSLFLINHLSLSLSLPSLPAFLPFPLLSSNCPLPPFHSSFLFLSLLFLSRAPQRKERERERAKRKKRKGKEKRVKEEERVEKIEILTYTGESRELTF